jgi:hypothetical protein
MDNHEYRGDASTLPRAVYDGRITHHGNTTSSNLRENNQGSSRGMAPERKRASPGRLG